MVGTLATAARAVADNEHRTHNHDANSNDEEEEEEEEEEEDDDDGLLVPMLKRELTASFVPVWRFDLAMPIRFTPPFPRADDGLSGVRRV